MPIYDYLVGIAIKKKTGYNFGMPLISLFYAPQNYFIVTTEYFTNSIATHHVRT